MKRFRLKPWKLLYLLTKRTPEGMEDPKDKENLEKLIARHDGDLSCIFEKKKKAIERQMREFEKYRPLLKQDITAPDFLCVISQYADIKTEMEKLCAASYLKFSENTANSTAKKNNYSIRIFNARMMNRLLFFDLWVRSGVDDVNFERITREAPGYEIFLVEQRRLKPHTLDESTEKLLNSLHFLGQVERLEYYEEVTSNLEFTIHEHVKVKQKGGKKKKVMLRKKTLNEAQLMPYMRHHKRAVREDAAKALFKGYGDVKDTLGGSFVIQGMEWQSEFLEKRGYKAALSARNHMNSLDDALVATVLSISKENTGLFQDYFVNIKKKLAGIKGQMDLNDLFAPINGMNGKKISYESCMNTIFEAFSDFSPKMASLLLEMEKKGFIHSKPQKNKWIGTYAYPTPPGILPYTLINFNGCEGEEINGGHEFGHGFQNIFSCERNKVLSYTPSDPVAEISSYFCEFLVFDKLFERAAGDEQQMKKHLIHFLDNAYEYTVKKANIVSFEQEAHKIIHAPGFEMDDLSNLYLKKLREQWGDKVHVPEYYKDEWLTVGNIMCAPFEDVSYPFGYFVASVLHDMYKKRGPEFAQNIINIMSAGDASIEEVLKREAGMDVKSEKFRQDCHNLLNAKVEQLRKLAGLESAMSAPVSEPTPAPAPAATPEPAPAAPPYLPTAPVDKQK